MGTTAGPGGGGSQGVDAMGFSRGQLVQELGWDSDTDEELRSQIMDAIDADMVDDPLEAVDAVLLWWRSDDGDVADGLVDALRDLSEEGSVWLLTPRIGRDGYVDPADIAEGAVTAGLVLANSVQASEDWLTQKVARPRGGRR